jgi:hypothetical protein
MRVLLPFSIAPGEAKATPCSLVTSVVLPVNRTWLTI